MVYIGLGTGTAEVQPLACVSADSQLQNAGILSVAPYIKFRSVGREEKWGIRDHR